jgi:hypothetical protein
MRLGGTAGSFGRERTSLKVPSAPTAHAPTAEDRAQAEQRESGRLGSIRDQLAAKLAAGKYRVPQIDVEEPVLKVGDLRRGERARTAERAGGRARVVQGQGKYSRPIRPDGGIGDHDRSGVAEQILISAGTGIESESRSGQREIGRAKPWCVVRGNFLKWIKIGLESCLCLYACQSGDQSSEKDDGFHINTH